MSTLINIREIQINITMRYHLTPVRMAIVKHSTKNQGWRGWGEMSDLLHWCWDVSRVEPLWRPCVCVLSHFSCVRRFSTLWTVTYQASLSAGFSDTFTGAGCIPSSRGPSQPRDRTCISYVSSVGRWGLYHQHRLGSPTVAVYQGDPQHYESPACGGVYTGVSPCISGEPTTLNRLRAAVVHSPSYCWLLQWKVAQQVLLSMGFPRKEYWNGWSFPSSGSLLTLGSNPRLLALQMDSLLMSHQGCPQITYILQFKLYIFNNAVYRNYKTLILEIKDNINRQGDVPCSWVGRISSVKISILSNAIYRFSAITELEKTFSQLIWKHNRPQIAKQSWERRMELEESTLQTGTKTEL